jgi:hypothetical protein
LAAFNRCAYDKTLVRQFPTRMTNFSDLFHRILRISLHDNQPITTIIKPIMAFSMHSHSGQFCPGHAKDSLEEVVVRAISLKMHLLALTEHMPRDQDADLYPEEVCPDALPPTLGFAADVRTKPIRSKQAILSRSCVPAMTLTFRKPCGCAISTRIASPS